MPGPRSLDHETVTPDQPRDDGFSLAGAMTWLLLVLALAGWVYIQYLTR